jgi:hypothetical protein
MSEPGSPFRIEPTEGGLRLSFDVRAKRGERQSKTAQFDTFEIVCDESTLIGGDNTAPPPLAYFAASLAF